MKIYIDFNREEYFKETDYLISICKTNPHACEYLTNLIIIDLVISLEVFCERIIKDFIERINSANKTSCQIPENIKFQQSTHLIKKFNDIYNHEHKRVECLEKLKSIRNLWEDNKSVIIDYTVKFPTGKHGEVQLSNLFNKIGISEILSKIKIKLNENLLNQEDFLDIQIFISDITNKRNLAIHEGIPLHKTISLESIQEIANNTEEILKQLNQIVNTELSLHTSAL